MIQTVTICLTQVNEPLLACEAVQAALALRYSDREPDFADFCLVRMSELHPKYPAITFDRTDFRSYRRNKREAIMKGRGTPK